MKTERKVFIVSKMIHTSKTGNKSLLLNYYEVENVIESSKDSKFVGYIVKSTYLKPEQYSEFNIGLCEVVMELGFDDKLRITGVVSPY